MFGSVFLFSFYVSVKNKSVLVLLFCRMLWFATFDDRQNCQLIEISH